jgi:hypothetical protein
MTAPDFTRLYAHFGARRTEEMFDGHGPSPGWRYSPATLSPLGRGDTDREIRK